MSAEQGSDAGNQSVPLDYARQTYLTAREAADFLRFPSVKAFHMWQRRQGIRSFRTGKRKLLFARKDLERAISSGVRRAV